MGDSELFSDLKSDFERSYRSEFLVAGLHAPPAQKLRRLVVTITMAYPPSAETKCCIWDGGAGEIALLGSPARLVFGLPYGGRLSDPFSDFHFRLRPLLKKLLPQGG